MNIETLKYPVGEFTFPEQVTKEVRSTEIKHIEEFPSRLQETLKNLSSEQLNWKYRPDGWTIHQVVHHCADSHMNALTRFKWALTEDHPTIKAYDQTAWAKLPDTALSEVKVSMNLIDSLHHRWVILLKHLEDQQWDRTFHHPEMERTIRLDQNLSLYSWHCQHHLGHVKQALKYGGVFEE